MRDIHYVVIGICTESNSVSVCVHVMYVYTMYNLCFYINTALLPIHVYTDTGLHMYSEMATVFGKELSLFRVVF